MAETTSQKRHLGITSSTFISTSDVTIGGNLTVDGTTVTLNTATLDVEDKNITLNKGGSKTSADGAGISIYRGTSSVQSFLWDDGNSRFEVTHPLYVTGTLTTNNHGNSSQWNTAYGWGNHASAGYASSSHGHDIISHNSTNYIDVNDHGGHTWFRNSSGVWTFQTGTGGDDWTQSFGFHLPGAGATANAVMMEIGQRNSNLADGRYKGVRIVKLKESTLVDGDFRAGSIYVGNKQKDLEWDTAYTHSQAAHAPSNAEQNVQSDWNATSGDAFIKNKPSIPAAFNGGDVSNPVIIDNTSANCILHWSKSGDSTGAIKITIPGFHSKSNWSMLVLRVTLYEYNSNTHTIYTVSGHDWTSGWYNKSIKKWGNSPKEIQFAYSTGADKDYLVLGETDSAFKYGHVTVDVIAHPGFYHSSMDISSGWSIEQTTDLSGLTFQKSTNVKVIDTNYSSVSNWDTAYGWGNHADGGYASSSHNHDGRYLRTHARLKDNLSSVASSGVYVWDVSEANDEPSGAADGLLTVKYWDSSSWATASFQDFHNRKLYITSKKSGTWLDTWAQVWTTDQLSTTAKSNYDTAYGWGNHADAGYLKSVTNVSGYSGTLLRSDNRVISPSEETAGRLKFGFTSWANDNTAPYADFLHLRSYTDSSGGNDNLVMFKKGGIGMRIWQQTWGSADAYKTYADVWTTGDFNSTTKGQWDTAYGWGNHADAGYASSSHNHDSVYLKKTAKAADSETVDGIDSSRIVYGANSKRSTRYDGEGIASKNQNSGFYYGYDPDGGPYEEWWNWITVAGASWASGNNYDFKLAHDFHSDSFYVSRMTNGSQGAWRKIVDESSASYNNGNWDTAYGWGNHASAGYLTSLPSHDHKGVHPWINKSTERGPDFDAIFPTSTNHVEFKEVHAINEGSNTPSGAYTYGVVRSTYMSSMKYQEYIPHTASRGSGASADTIWFRSNWGGNNWYPWRYHIHSGNIGSQSVDNASKLDGIDSSSFLRSDTNDTASGSYSFTNSYNEFGNSTGSVSNDGSWNARVNIAGSQHARLDVKSVSDGIITTMFAHTGNNAGKIGTKSNHKLDFIINGSTKATLETSGLLRCASDIVAYYNFSDRRLKTNIESTENNLEKVLALNPVSYQWKEGDRKGKTEIGLIAQEVEEIIPEVVREQGRLEDEDVADYKTVDYEKLVSTLIGAIQEQQKQIDELKSKMCKCNGK